MNRDINFTLSALVPLLRMNGEKVVSVEAVEDWYEIDGREYMKEVAEITYENGYRQYADIGCDANLTAVYDVIRVIQQVKPKSEKIERIVRDVYPKPDVPDTNVGNKAQLSDKVTTFENGGTPSGKWIKHIDDLFPEESTMECDQCHEHQPITIDDNFCPNCGADMRGKSDGHSGK